MWARVTLVMRNETMPIVVFAAALCRGSVRLVCKRIGMNDTSCCSTTAEALLLCHMVASASSLHSQRRRWLCCVCDLLPVTTLRPLCSQFRTISATVWMRHGLYFLSLFLSLCTITRSILNNKTLQRFQYRCGLSSDHLNLSFDFVFSATLALDLGKSVWKTLKWNRHLAPVFGLAMSLHIAWLRLWLCQYQQWFLLCHCHKVC